MRRARRIFLFLLIALIVAVLTTPWWINLPLRWILARNDISYATYTTHGYTRFALTDIRVTTPSADIAIGRLETETPWIYLWKRALTKPGPIAIDNYTVTLKPTTDTAPSSEPTGIIPTRDLANRLRTQLAPWLPALALTNGQILLSEKNATPLRIADITLTQDPKTASLTLNGLAYRDYNANAKITWDADALALTTTLDTPQTLINADIHLSASTLRIDLRAYEQNATLTAQLAPTGWLPTEALLDAPQLTLTAVQLAHYKLPPYDAAKGSARIEYRDGRLTADITTRTETRQTTQTLPPLNLALHAQGTPEQIDITTLDIALPGLTAKLAAPVTITRELRVTSGKSRFTLDADLAQQPWIKAQGRMTGHIDIDPTPRETLRAEATFTAENIHAYDIALSRIALSLTQEQTRTQLHTLELTLPDGSQATANGQYDEATRTLKDVTLKVHILPAAIARWIPADITFKEATLDLALEGPDTAPAHRGTLNITHFDTTATHPAQLTATWQGHALTAETLTASLSATNTELTLGAADLSLSPGHATITGLTLCNQKTERLRLTAPARVEWAPDGTLTLAPLNLATPQGIAPASELALQLALSPRATSSFSISTTNIKSADLADLFAIGPVSWNLIAAKITGETASTTAPLTANASFNARIDYGTVVANVGDAAYITATATLTPTGINIAQLAVTDTTADDTKPVARITGLLPITIYPRTTPLLRIDKNATLVLDAHTEPDSPFWQSLARATGITLESPRINANLTGTWEKLTATADVEVTRIAFDPTHWPKILPPLPQLPPLPPLTALAAHLTTDGNTLTLENVSVRIADQELRAKGQIPLPFAKLKDATLTLQIPDADLAAFADYTNAILAPRGHISAEINIAPGKPLDGRITLHDATLRPLAPLGIINTVNIDARFNNRRLEIIKASALVGNEPAELSGNIDFSGDLFIATLQDTNAKLRFKPDLAFKATNVPFVRQPGLLVRGDIDLKLNTAATPDDTPRIQGTVTLRDSLFLADLRSLWSTRPASGPASRPPFFAVETPPLNGWLLDLDVRGERFLRLQTTVFNGRASAAFKIDGTLGDPRAIGEATIDSGKVILPFANFTAQSGSVRLTQASPHVPRIDFTATARSLGYDLRMEVNGTPAAPNVTFTSSPALSSEQILLFVMGGEAPNNEVDTSSQQRAFTIGSYLGQSFINDIFGLSSEEGRLTLTSGEKLTRQGRETYSVDYKLDDHWTAVGEYDEFDAYNIGLKWLAYRSKTPAQKKAAAVAEAKNEASPATPENPKPTKIKPATIKVTGEGWWTNLQHTRMLERTLSIDDKHPATLTANEIEDATFLLVSQLIDDGYQHPKIEIAATPEKNAAPLVFKTDATLALTLPRELHATEAVFKVDEGTRYNLTDVTFSFTGPHTITEAEARTFFLPKTALFGSGSSPYSPAALKRFISALQESLKQKGYINATVTLATADIDDSHGDVTAHLIITQGPISKIASLETKIAPSDATYDIDQFQKLTEQITRNFTSRTWSEWTQQDISEHVRQYYYRLGHPDIKVAITTAPPIATADKNELDVPVKIVITPGPQVRIGTIGLVGNHYTRTSLLQRRIRQKPGDLFNPLALESSRYRLSNLGAFRNIDLTTTPVDDTTRDVQFNFVENARTDINLLIGYGSYEQLRGGIELHRLNALGIADETRLLLVESMKSTRGDLTWGVPDLFARNVNGSVRLFGLRREEVAFERVEYGGTATLRRAWRARGYEVSAGYTYESLNNSDDTLSPEAGETGRTIAAAINLSLTRDKRDNPLTPKHGYNWYLQAEIASHTLGGEADYQRYRAGFTYHTSWGNTRWIHAGISQGLIKPIGDMNTPLPVNKLFYPGGENSIRGYQDGEAAPRDSTGAFLGAKVYSLLNLELEQALVGSLSIVVFYDLLGDSARVADYPGTEWLNSAGIGFRYHTILGPLRLEYGRNLNPRADDPKGTLHFSVGVPF